MNLNTSSTETASDSGGQAAIAFAAAVLTTS